MSPSSGDGPDASDVYARYARLVTHYSAPEIVATALERVKAEARRREKAKALVVRARGGVLHNHTVRQIAGYFRAADRGRVELLQVAEGTGIPLSEARQVLLEFVDAGLLAQYDELVGNQVRRTYELADGAQGGITEVFVETEAARRLKESDGGAQGVLGWE
ncbi:hypothetical protein ACFCYC_15255 [Streptomyces sp. NPDC056402]|uniref:hypothetical protein n=1 Tax=Streptomyces sp. NPDC056402 TaxID=3345810 RepID=UPI0035D75237